jgi:hypothetical protein
LHHRVLGKYQAPDILARVAVASLECPGNNMDMDSIQFNTVIGEDQVIHLPAGVSIPSGMCEVTITPAPSTTEKSNSLAPGSWEWLLALAADAERVSPPLPSDMAENHDFYAHGKPRE